MEITEKTTYMDVSEEIEEIIEEPNVFDEMEESCMVKLKRQFELFAKFGDRSADGSSIRLSQSDKWWKQVRLGPGRNTPSSRLES
jgi:hypothetical protein